MSQITVSKPRICSSEPAYSVLQMVFFLGGGSPCYVSESVVHDCDIMMMIFRICQSCDTHESRYIL